MSLDTLYILDTPLRHCCEYFTMYAHVSRTPNTKFAYRKLGAEISVCGVEVVSFRNPHPDLETGLGLLHIVIVRIGQSRIKLLLQSYEFVVSRRVDYEPNG